jgi:aryl-alcohol dehydrogenase-like predicted oxidoreductase
LLPSNDTALDGNGDTVSHAVESRRRLGSTGLDISPVVLGTMQFGWTVTDVEAMRILDAYMWAGGNAVDTANMYGGDQTLQMFAPNAAHVGVSEDTVGRWMQTRHCRDAMVLSTKVRARMWPGDDGEGLRRDHILRAVEDSLRRLRTDHVDVLYAHWPDPAADAHEWLSAFGELVQAGKVRHVGTSNFCGFDDYGDVLSPLLAMVDSEAGLPRLEVEQPRYNLLNRAEYEARLQGIAFERGMAIVCYSALAGGFLAGRYGQDREASGVRSAAARQYQTAEGWRLLETLHRIAGRHGVPVASISLAWTLAQPGVTGVIVGPDSVQELAEASAAPDVRLSTEELTELEDCSWSASQPEFVTW